jgi:hypothetical protein
MSRQLDFAPAMLLTDVFGGFNAFVGVIAAAAAVGAVVLAWKSWQAAIKANTAADRVDRRSLQPRPELAFAQGVRLDSEGRLVGELFNAGGDATRLMAVIHAGPDLFVYLAPAPAHSRIPVAIARHATAPSRSDVPLTIVFIAKDLNGTWWDARSATMISGDLYEWLQSEYRKVGLPMVAIPEWRPS